MAPPPLIMETELESKKRKRHLRNGKVNKKGETRQCFANTDLFPVNEVRNKNKRRLGYNFLTSTDF